MFKVVSVPAAVSAGKIVGTISFFSFAPIRPMLNVGEPTTTVVAEEGDDVSVCCAGAEVVLSALLLLLPLMPLPSPVWAVEEDTVPGGRTFTITPVAIADPLLLISILNGLTTPGSALTIGNKPDSVPCVLVLEEDVITAAAVLRITLPVSRNGISSVVDSVSSSSCSATL